MAKHAVSVLLLFISILAFTHLSLAEYDQTFDYFQLVLTWPISYCSHIYCAINPLPYNFIIHGFWPTNFYGPFLLYCNGVPPYTPITWQVLIDGLNRNWPNIIDGVNYNFEVWQYQWERHGTCSLIFYYQMMYFDLAVELKEKFDLLVGLEDRKIAPTNSVSYSVQDIKNAVKDLTTKVPDVGCVISTQGKLLISEIRICFTPGGEIMDCFAHLAIGCTSPFAYFPENLM